MFFGYQARLSLSLSLFSHSTRLEGGREAVTDGAERRLVMVSQHPPESGVGQPRERVP